MAVCFFQCGITGKELTTAGASRINTIIESSRLRRDGLHIELQKQLDDNDTLTIQCHRDCVSTYTSCLHVNRQRKRDGMASVRATSAPPPVKRTCRSELAQFNFRKHCLFCGEDCVMTRDTKNPSRWRIVKLCRSGNDGPTDDTIKDVINKACDRRKDEWANQVQLRLQGAISDLEAVGARYHADCKASFMAPRAVQAASEALQSQSEVADTAFWVVVDTMKSEVPRVWSSTELYSLYQSHDGSLGNARVLVNKLSDLFGRDLVIFSAPGVASIVMFHCTASAQIRLDGEDKEASVTSVANTILKETKRLGHTKELYTSRMSIDTGLESVSATLLTLLATISDKLNQSLPSVLIGNIITSLITHRPTPLLVALGVLVREKNVIESLYDFGVTCSYDEVLRFKASAAKEAATNTVLRGISDSSIGLVQAVADNFDANISSQNGLQSTHAIALLLTQPQSTDQTCSSQDDTIKRLKKEDMKVTVTSEVTVQQYSGPKKPNMPECKVKHSVPTLKYLAGQTISMQRASCLDLEFMKSVCNDSSTPEFGGFNTKKSREQGHSTKPSSKAVYTPLIDMVPADPTTMMTTMVEAQKLTRQTGQVYTIFTADQQLYRVMIDVMWVYPDRFSNFIPRLGGMHMLMSFVGCVGVLMTNSGLDDILKAAFAGVARMLNGKNFPQNTRALRMVTEELLRDVITDAESYTDLMDLLEKRSDINRTTKLWVDCLIKPVFIMMLFVRAEREADWPLHVRSVKEMLPYFFAAGHVNYARYGLYYLRAMESLPDEVLHRFMKGEHVMRHKAGLWNGMWSDMFIETTFMRYGHGPGGLVGITLNKSALKRWALSLHICSRLTNDIADMRDEVTDAPVTKHVEERRARIISDSKDREKIRAKLQSCLDPLNTDVLPRSLMNIVTGKLANETVNVDKAVSIGRDQMTLYEQNLPHGFYVALSKKVVTLAESKHSLKIGTEYTFDTELIYSRAMCLLNTRDTDLDNVFEFELAPIPTSMFDETGDMRTTNTKSILKKKLEVEQSPQTVQQEDVTIIDGCAVLWIIHWPTNGTIQDYVDGFIGYIHKKLSKSDIYLVFDRYYEYSIKSATRTMRITKQTPIHHKLTLSSPLPSQQVILTVTENKVQLIDMICTQLLDEGVRIEPTSNIFSHRLVVTGSDPEPRECYKCVVIERHDLRTLHEEADVIMTQQMVELAKQGTSCIKIVCDDTDVFILLVHMYSTQELTCTLLMEGTSSQRTLINIGTTVSEHADIATHLLAMHAISGCDTVAYLFGVGKATALKVLRKGYILEHLGNQAADMNTVIDEATKFIANCYGSAVTDTMSKARYQIWLHKLANRKVTASPKLKSIPPTTAAFVENVKRAHLQMCIWNSTLDEGPPDMDPTDFGWIKEETSKTLSAVAVPCGLPAAPQDILQMIRCGCSSNQPCATGRCGCNKGNLACTIFCACYRERNCRNHWTKYAEEQLPDDEDNNEN